MVAVCWISVRGTHGERSTAYDYPKMEGIEIGAAPSVSSQAGSWSVTKNEGRMFVIFYISCFDKVVIYYYPQSHDQVAIDSESVILHFRDLSEKKVIYSDACN